MSTVGAMPEDQQQEGSATRRVAGARPPRGAAEIFGERLPLAIRYADLLATSGVTRGLLGPREGERLWDRHILNCAVVESLLPHRTRVIDVGSGAGLPGLVLAIARPDLDVALIEPMQRRTDWLQEAVADLELANVAIHRGRAEEFRGRLQAAVVTSRAVARLGELARVCLPLVSGNGRMLAVKGESAEQELTEEQDQVKAAGGGACRVILLGDGVTHTPTRVVEVLRAQRPEGARGRGGASRRQRAARGDG